MFMCVWAHGGQKRAQDSVGLDLQVVVSHSMWVLITELKSSSRTVFSLKY